MPERNPHDKQLTQKRMIIFSKNKQMKLWYMNNLKEIMKISEISFSEWDNDEDEVYNDL